VHGGCSARLGRARRSDERAVGWNHPPENAFEKQVVYKGDPMLKLIRNLFVLRQAWKMIKRRR
jgi:hypothetical protein